MENVSSAECRATYLTSRFAKGENPDVIMAETYGQIMKSMEQPARRQLAAAMLVERVKSKHRTK